MVTNFDTDDDDDDDDDDDALTARTNLFGFFNAGACSGIPDDGNEEVVLEDMEVAGSEAAVLGSRDVEVEVSSFDELCNFSSECKYCMTRASLASASAVIAVTAAAAVEAAVEAMETEFDGDRGVLWPPAPVT